MDYRSEGDTRLTIDGSRHYKTPYGALPSVTTILSATSGSITLTPANGQNVTVGGTNTNFTAAEIHGTLGEFTTLRTDTLQSDTSANIIMYLCKYI